MPGRRLSLAEREEISIGLERKEPIRQIAVRIGRDPGDGVTGGAAQPVAVAAALPGAGGACPGDGPGMAAAAAQAGAGQPGPGGGGRAVAAGLFTGPDRGQA